MLTKYTPDRVIIEPSGVGKLSDVMKAVRDVAAEVLVTLNSAVTVADASKCRMYMKNFGEFFNNQIECAGTIVLSRTDITDPKKVQKAVELGVYRVIPVATRRAIVKLDKKKEESRVRRWNAISETAAKQSGRGMIPDVSGVVSCKEALEQTKDFEIKLIPYENARGMARTRELLDSVRPGNRVAVFIGPEGGFEEEEVAMAVEAGAEPVTLGKRILRTETAGLAMLAALGFWMEE